MNGYYVAHILMRSKGTFGSPKRNHLCLSGQGVNNCFLISAIQRIIVSQLEVLTNALVTLFDCYSEHRIKTNDE